MERKRRWRQYATASERKPVQEFLDGLPPDERLAVISEMKEVEHRGLRVARHLRGEIWEARADGEHAIYRLLFAVEGRRGQVLLALEAFKKKTQKTPPPKLELAERRLRDWRKRGRRLRLVQQ